MKRFVTIALVSLLSSIAFTAAAQAQLVFDLNVDGRDGFYATGLNIDDVYAVSATVNGASLSVYDSPAGGPVTQIAAFDAGDGTGELYLFIIPPTSGGTVTLTATLLGPDGNPTSTVLTGSKTYRATTQKTATSTTLNGTPLSQVYGAIILTANVAASPTPNSGTVTFYNNGSALSPAATVSLGVAIIHADGLPVGNHTITASYSGDNTYQSSDAVARPLAITPANLTVNGITADNKVYDGSMSATLHTTGAVLQGVVAGDNVTLNTGSAAGTFADKDVANGKTVTVSGVTVGGTSVSNYLLTQPSTTANITAKELTVSGIAANDKTYDGSSNANLTTNSPQLVGLVVNDHVNLHVEQAVGSFADKNVGTNKPVVVSGIFVNGPDVADYTLTQPTLSASISKATASVTPLAASKTYGAPEPVLSGSLSGFVVGDNVTATYSRTTGETVAGGPYTISATLSPAAALSNYTITYNTASFTITKALASVNPAAASKTYGEADPTFGGTLTGFASGDGVTATYSRIAGESVAGGPYTISATLGPVNVLGNYTITYNTASLTINKAPASVTPNAASKTYGAADPALTGTLTGFVQSDGVTASYTRAAGETVVGSPYAISATLSPAAALANYTVTYNSGAFTITKATVTPSITVSNKVYDGTTAATIATSTLTGIIGSDDVSLAGGVATFADANVGDGKTVTGSGFSVSGSSVGNYQVSSTSASTTANITKATASVTPAAASKTYGTADPTLSGSLTGFVSGDGVTATYSRAAGESAGQYTISAALTPTNVLGNYNVTYNTALFTVTKALASVTPNAVTKVYGTSDPTLTGTLSGFLPADNVTATYARTTGETVAGSPYTISATLSPTAVLPNYDITYNTANFGITTNVSTTALSASAATSVYGQPVTFTATVTGAGTPSGTVTFKDGATSLGTGTLNGSGVATLSISTLQVAGSPHAITAVYGGDGNLASSTSSAIQQTVTAKALTVSGITASNKVYDGTTNAVINTSTAALSGLVVGDDVSLNVAAAAGNFNDKNIGTTKPVAVTGLALTGTAAGNYSLSQPTTTANITAKNLTVTGITANDKVYDGTTTATLNTSSAALVGVASGDNVALNTSGAAGTFADKEIGTAKIVTITGLTLSGTDAGNYTLTQPTATANITAPPVNTGSVAGAGWVSSPAGAFVKSSSTTGRGYFVFAAAYIGKNPLTPTGLVAFQLKTKGLFYPSVLSFTSAQFEALVISGSQATLTGTGTVDGSGSYGFLLSVIDGQGLLTGNKLRLKVWDKNHNNAVVYDNQMGAGDNASPTGAVTGLIAVSKSGGSTAVANVSLQQLIEEDAATEMPTQYELYNAYPNPFNPSTTIRFDLPEATKVHLVVYDMLGREVAVLADGERPAGQYSVRFDAGKLSSGTYIYRLQTGNYIQTRKLMLMK